MITSKEKMHVKRMSRFLNISCVLARASGCCASQMLQQKFAAIMRPQNVCDGHEK